MIAALCFGRRQQRYAQVGVVRRRRDCDLVACVLRELDWRRGFAKVVHCDETCVNGAGAQPEDLVSGTQLDREGGLGSDIEQLKFGEPCARTARFRSSSARLTRHIDV